MKKHGLIIIGIMCVWLQAALAVAAGGRVLPFSGRLLDDQGKPVSGPVDLQLNFFRTEADATPLPLPPYNFYKMDLSDGVFHVKIMTSESDLNVLNTPGNIIYLQVKDVTHDRVYRRQKFDMTTSEPLTQAAPAPSPAPQAAASPAASATQPNPPAAGQVTGVDFDITRAAIAACVASPGAGAKFVTGRDEVAGAQTCTNVCALSAPGAACIRGWTLFGNNQYLEFGSECNATPVLASVPVVGRLCCCLNLRGPSPLFMPSTAAPH